MLVPHNVPREITGEGDRRCALVCSIAAVVAVTATSVIFKRMEADIDRFFRRRRVHSALRCSGAIELGAAARAGELADHARETGAVVVIVALLSAGLMLGLDFEV